MSEATLLRKASRLCAQVDRFARDLDLAGFWHERDMIDNALRFRFLRVRDRLSLACGKEEPSSREQV